MSRHRRRRPLFRRRLKPSFWQRQWQRLSISQQKRIKSMAWAISSHFLLVAILAAIGLSNPNLVTISLQGAITPVSEISIFEILPTAELEETITEELEILEPEQPTLDESLKNMLEFDTPLEIPTETVRETGDTSQSTTLSQVQMPMAVSELQNDYQRIAETNRRVAAAGGKLDGPIRVSLIFSGDDDLDLHVQYQEAGRASTLRRDRFGRPVGFSGMHLYYGNPRSQHAALDVDANAQFIVADPCENIIFTSVPKVANYTVGIHHFRARGNTEPTQYVLLVNYGKRTKVFEGTILPQDGLKIIWQFKYSH